MWNSSISSCDLQEMGFCLWYYQVQQGYFHFVPKNNPFICGVSFKRKSNKNVLEIFICDSGKYGKFAKEFHGIFRISAYFGLINMWLNMESSDPFLFSETIFCHFINVGSISDYPVSCQYICGIVLGCNLFWGVTTV